MSEKNIYDIAPAENIDDVPGETRRRDIAVATGLLGLVIASSQMFCDVNGHKGPFDYAKAFFGSDAPAMYDGTTPSEPATPYTPW